MLYTGSSSCVNGNIINGFQFYQFMDSPGDYGDGSNCFFNLDVSVLYQGDWDTARKAAVSQCSMTPGCVNVEIFSSGTAGKSTVCFRNSSAALVRLNDSALPVEDMNPCYGAYVNIGKYHAKRWAYQGYTEESERATWAYTKITSIYLPRGVFYFSLHLALHPHIFTLCFLIIHHVLLYPLSQLTVWSFTPVTLLQRTSALTSPKTMIP
jgi:hypothetical protein